MNLIANLFFRQPEDEPYPAEKYCTICEGRIWPWTKTVRLRDLGMTRAHFKCASEYLRSKLTDVIRTIPRKP